MKKTRNLPLFIMSVCFLILEIMFASCSSGKSIKIVNWNCQTFFDGKTDGCEYKEFKNKDSGWNEDTYRKRLSRLCDTLETLDGDVVVLEEIENQNILYDISNILQRNSMKRKNYRYCCFSKEPGSSIGIAVLSRFRLSDLKVHSINIVSSDQPSMRPVMEVTVAPDDKKSFVLYANHWKSKSGGKEKTEKWRNQQEILLSRLIFERKCLQYNVPVLCSGDFNRDYRDFSFNENEDIILGNNENVILYSPWKDFEGCFGSYYFRGLWEKIDHFFYAGNMQVVSFDCCNEGPWADEESRPFPYRMFSKTGFSDHLPISIEIKLL